MKKIILFAVIVIFFNTNFAIAAQTQVVKLHTIMLSGDYRKALNDIVFDFNAQHANITLEYSIDLNDVYHQYSDLCLKQDQCSADIYIGFAGYNFEQLIAQNKIEDITELWETQNFDQYFSHLESTVSIDNKQYGLPISYYPWGFFYKKSLFERLQILPPTNWSEFMHVTTQLQAQNITPIIIGTKTPFPAASWFSYLNLRLHGLEFHQQLTASKISYHDKRVRETFEFWKILIDQGLFTATNAKFSYTEVLPLLYREQGGMYLMGNIILSKIPDKIIDDIGFFRFPQIDPSLPMFEEAPLDLLFIPKSAKNKMAAKQVLAFFAQPENLFKLNKAAGYLSANALSRDNEQILLKQTADHLKSSDGFSYFFNRNSPPEMARAGTKLLGAFVSNPNIDNIIEEFEKLRELVKP